MSLQEAVGSQTADRWISTGRRIADFTDPKRSALLTDDQIGALHGYTTNEGYQWINLSCAGRPRLARRWRPSSRMPTKASQSYRPTRWGYLPRYYVAGGCHVEDASRSANQ